MHYNKLNNLVGWLVFLIATAVYFMTIEDTASLWDCGEYITAAYKLEVGHPPGAPLFMVIGRLFSFFAAPENVAMWINRMSALSSSATILFMFWSITMLARKVVQQNTREISLGDQIAILGSGVVGALAYTFSDSFWFSAVEGEVYAMSSLFTAAIFWAILKWDAEMIAIRHSELSRDHSPLRWIILIMFLFGLAIGVHLLGLLAIPAVVYIIYFNVTNKVKIGGFILIGLVSVILLNLIQNAIIPNVIGNASLFEVFFTNSVGMPFNSGAIIYFALVILFLLLPFLLKQGNKAHMYYLIGLVPLIVLFLSDFSGIMWAFCILNIIVALVVYSSNDNPYQALIFAYFSFILGPLIFFFAIPEESFLRKGKTKELEATAYTAMKMVTMSLITLLIGYGSFAVIVIRSNANTPLDENDPENLVTLQAYLKREQYGSWPIAYGPYWNSKMDEDVSKYGDLSAFYLRRFVVQKDGLDIKGFKSEADAKKFAGEKGPRYEVTEKYFMTNESVRQHQKPVYSQNTLLPRMYWNQEPNKVAKYKEWSGYRNETDADPDNNGTDGLRLPTFGENMTYMMRYQMNWMYWRYFMWNFAGRQNDMRGHGDAMRGNWLSGVNFVDNMRLGNQEYLPTYTANNESHNRFYFLPLILGLIGMLFHFYRAPKDAFVVFLTFIFTGVAIIFYLNQKPYEPRERDYAFAASFYAFAMWIGLSVLALYEAWKSFGSREWRLFGYSAAGIFGVVLFGSLIASAGKSSIAACAFVLIAAAVLTGIMYALRKTIKSQTASASLAVVLTIFVPILMAKEGWDDHDRSGKTSARDIAHNYLNSCAKNSVIFTTGDNDTFPLWYYQEVEGKRTDVRVCNLSLMQTDWYTEQMMRKAYDSDPLPITFREDQILAYAGNTESVYLLNISTLASAGIRKEALEPVFNLKKKYNRPEFNRAYTQFRNTTSQVMATVSSKDAVSANVINNLRAALNVVNPDSATYDVVEAVNGGILEVFKQYSAGMIDAKQESLAQLQDLMRSWESSWDYIPLKEAMDFVKNDENMINDEGRYLRAFPAKGFILPISAENAVKSGVIDQKDAARCEKDIRFVFSEQGLQKEQVMMLDMMANNNWKRAVYYSSPAGQEVAMALLNTGHLRQNGMAWELSPIRSRDGINDERMYKNLMEVYTFGDMKNPDVLTDNYARDQTGPMRSQFMQLAQFYLRKIDEGDAEKMQYESNIQRARAGGAAKIADSLQKVYDALPKYDAAMCKQRAISLVKRSLEVMPPENVIDLGEPTPGRDSLMASDGTKYVTYNDGVLQNYVSILYQAGDKAAAEKLGNVVASQLESIIIFFQHSDPDFAAENIDDLASATRNYMLINALANDKEFGDPGSQLATRTNKMAGEMFGKIFPKMVGDLKNMAIENGEVVRVQRDMGYLTSLYFDLSGTIESIGIDAGIIGQPQMSPSSTMPAELPQMPLDTIPNDMVLTDSNKSRR